ncbi:hypothetical protein AGMMS49574_29900 [Bacteroidia bacterium]|nr:hypothetical protein AGMMS49574_29900 [Bacteroidia bacterium]
MDKWIKYKGLFFWLTVYCVLFAFLQVYSEFHFYFIEQNQLFQNSWSYIAEHLLQPGGCAFVGAEFLVQFFLVPFAGASITAALLTGAGALTYALIKRIVPLVANRMLVLCLLPVLGLLFIQFDFNYLAYGTVAYLLMLTALYLILSIQAFTVRFVGHLLVTGLLFYLAGPVFVLYAALAVIYEMLYISPRHYFTLLVLFEAMMIGILSVYLGMFGEYCLVFLPDGYYNYNIGLVPTQEIYFAWWSLLFIFILPYILQKRKAISRKRLLIETAVLLILIAFICKSGVSGYGDKKSALMKELDYYCRTEQWDKILERSQGSLTNYLYLCYANLALTNMGELGDKIFMYDQRGSQGLMVGWNKTTSVSVLLSDIYFAINDMAPAQEMAFEANVSAISAGNPRMVKRLVETNLIYGEYPVAEKYISILEHTFAYKDWASAQRRFLYQDAEVEKDSLLGNKRRSLVQSRLLALVEGLDADLQQIAEVNPSATSSIEYCGALYLMSKDMTPFQAMVERYFGTPVLPVLPRSFQEAVILLSENNPDIWKHYQLSEVVIQRFLEFKKQFIDANRSGNSGALKGLLQRSYGDTFWFYFTFK